MLVAVVENNLQHSFLFADFGELFKKIVLSALCV